MLSLYQYVTYEEIRGVLGVSEYELTNDTLDLPMYARTLQLRLTATTGTFDGTTGSLLDIYTALLAVTPPLSISQENMKALIQQYAVYVVAEACLSGLSLLALKSETDGKTSQSRFSAEATFRDVAMNIRQMLNSLAGQIEQALTGTSATAALPLLNRVAPATDVVTNESA